MARSAADQRTDKSGRSATQTNSTNSGRSASSPPTSERERSIETNREQTRDRTDVARQRPSGELNTLGGSPFAFMRRMAEDMDRLFNDFGFAGSSIRPDRDFWRGSSDLDRATWAPQLETLRRGDNIVIRADLPGMKKEDVNVEVDNGMLTISGERHEEHEDKRDDFYRTERRYGRFYRALPLPEDVTSDRCEATFKDGVLEVTIPAPKQAQAKSKRVPVR
jgi:HSP20 family protein